MDNDKDDDELRAANEGRERCWEEEGREIYLQSRLLMRTVLNAAAHTALYLAAGLFPLSPKNGADPSPEETQWKTRTGIASTGVLTVGVTESCTK